MRKWIALAAAVGVLSFAGCDSEPTTINEPTSSSDTQYHGELGDDEPTPIVIDNLSAAHTYDDGVIFQPIVTTGTTDGTEQYRYGDEVPKGKAYVEFKYRVTNGTAEPFDAIASFGYPDITYGPEVAEPSQDDELETTSNDGSTAGFNTHIMPGKSRTDGTAYLIPSKYWGEMTIEVTRGGHPTLIYTVS